MAEELSERNDREKVRAVLLLMKDGLTMPQIAEALGMGTASVSRMASKKNLEQALEMLEMADEGLTLQEIGDHFGVTRQRVAQIIGRQVTAGSRGRTISINAAPETWKALEHVADSLDIPVRGLERDDRLDSRALVMLFDMIANGEVEVKRVRRKRGKS